MIESTRTKAALALLVLVAVTPLFGWAAAQVNYAEPLENAAEATGATEHERPVHPGPLPDYGVPGLGSVSGTVVAAAVGTALTLAVATGLGRLVERADGTE